MKYTLLLLLAGCSAPHYYEVTPFFGESTFDSPVRGFDTTGMMFTIGWNLQAERHHREDMLETARATGRTPLALMPPEERQEAEDALTKAAANLLGKDAPTDAEGGAAYLMWALGVSLILGMLALLRFGSSLWRKNAKK